MVEARDESIYTYKNGRLFQVISAYKSELRKIAANQNCEIEEQIKSTLLTQNSLSLFTKELEQCSGDSFQPLLEKPCPQVSILALGSTLPYTRNLHIGYEYGFLVEFRGNRIHPNYSIGLGYFQNDVTNTVIAYKYPISGIEHTVSKVNSSSALLKLNYHFRSGTDFRPFISFNSRVLSYDIEYYSVDTKEFLFDASETEYKIGGSVGVDYYLYRFIQLRAEVEYTNTLSYYIGLGIPIY